ncbi:hypothetical protein [Streptomyces sp. Z26]|uniref:hypothetical protein n=1 Tax=Streptomyces sp. Z26 TaxID=2500177 RepID=UPI001F0CA378|nr:hypothetical protein [Streptomyces sp. Z26]
MTTALAVTSHGHMLTPPDRHTPRAHIFTPPDEQSLDDALTETHTLLEQHGYLIAVYPETLPTPYVHRLHAIRSILESDRIALLPTALPPLATGVLARQLRQLSLCDFSPGVLGSAARLLGHYIHAGALLNSVAKLDRIPVSLTAHAKSWMPGTQFGVLAAPEPALVRLGGSGEQGKLAGPQYATRLTVASSGIDGEWVTRTLATQWRVSDIHEAYLPDDSARWWGTGKLVEFAAAISDLSVLYQLVASVRRDECHWCGLEIIGDRCAFCSATLPPEPPGTGAGTGTAAAARAVRAKAPRPRGPRPQAPRQPRPQEAPQPRAEGRSAEGRSVPGQTAPGRPVEGRPVEGRSVDGRSGEGLSARQARSGRSGQPGEPGATDPADASGGSGQPPVQGTPLPAEPGRGEPVPGRSPQGPPPDPGPYAREPRPGAPAPGNPYAQDPYPQGSHTQDPYAQGSYATHPYSQGPPAPGPGGPPAAGPSAPAHGPPPRADRPSSSPSNAVTVHQGVPRP